MPTDDIDKLTGPDLAAVVAREVMGWGIMHPTGMTESWFSGINSGHIGFEADRRHWRPHIDRNDAHRVLLRCEELGLVVETWKQVRCGGPGCPAEWSDWDYMTISPLEVCRAALRAVQGSK